ncbi:MAG: GerAB/ArcD/ProY family transporter, partial [Bacillota bacterium]
MSKTAAITDESAKSKISSLQFMFLIITLVIATADVFLPAFVAQEAERDSWISAIIGTISSLVIVNIFIALALRHPDKTFIEYSCDILGKPLGKLCGFIFLYYVFMVTVMVTKQLGEIFVTSFNPEAPILIYIISVILVASYAVGKGIEVISRVNEILLPIGLA